jgi:hypothetical protein
MGRPFQERKNSMPISYQFIDKQTGAPILLQELDDKLCALFNRPVDERKYSPEYLKMINDMLYIFFHGAFDKARYEEVTQDDPIAKKALDYIMENFDYSSWR